MERTNSSLIIINAVNHVRHEWNQIRTSDCESTDQARNYPTSRLRLTITSHWSCIFFYYATWKLFYSERNSRSLICPLCILSTSHRSVKNRFTSFRDDLTARRYVTNYDYYQLYLYVCFIVTIWRIVLKPWDENVRVLYDLLSLSFLFLPFLSSNLGARPHTGLYQLSNRQKFTFINIKA